MAMESQQNITRLESWTKEEKFKLYQALKLNGSQNLTLISGVVGRKSEEEIKNAIHFYKQRVPPIATSKKKKSRKNNHAPVIPLASWANFILDSYGFENLQTETSTALRLIANFEAKPPGVCTEKIDFRKVYHTLADATEGKAIPYDKSIMTLYDKCTTETALTSKAFIKSSTYKRVLQSINIAEQDINLFSKPTINNELTTLRHLACQKSYNPLNIAEDYLKSSSHKA